jgi:chromosome segregation ATPase
MQVTELRSRNPMMRRYAKLFLMRIPAVRQYLADKRSLAAALHATIEERDRFDSALKEAEAQRNILVAEISYLRATGENFVRDRNVARDEVVQIKAAATFLAAARDSALDEAKQARDARESLLLDREKLLAKIKQLQGIADAAVADRDLFHTQIIELRKVGAKLTVDIEISCASLMRAIAENERLRTRVAEDPSALNRGVGHS